MGSRYTARALATCRDEWPAIRWYCTSPYGAIGGDLRTAFGTSRIRIGVTVARGQPVVVTTVGAVCIPEPIYFGGPWRNSRVRSLRAALRLARRQLCEVSGG